MPNTAPADALQVFLHVRVLLGVMVSLGLVICRAESRELAWVERQFEVIRGHAHHAHRICTANNRTSGAPLPRAHAECGAT